MTTQLLNLIEASVIAVAGILLLTMALKRHYPRRSTLVYLILALVTLTGVVTAAGAFAHSSLEEEFDPSVYAFLAGMLRGAAIVTIASLLVYEAKYRPRKCPYRFRKDSRCHMESMKLPDRDV